MTDGKEKGRVRLGALSIVAIVVVALVVAVNVFKNPIVKHCIKSGLENVFWARADIGYVNLKIFDSSLTVRDVAVANKDKPMENLFEVGNFTLDFDLVQLLKRGFVVELAQCTGVTYGTPRKVSGALSDSVIKAKEAKKEARSDAFEKKKNELLASLAKSSRSELADILGTYDPENFLDDALNELQTPAMKDKFVAEADRIRSSWEDEIEATQKEVKSFSSDIEDLLQTDFGKKRTPQEIAALVAQFTDAISRAKSLQEKGKSLAERFESDTKSLQNMTVEFQKSVRHDGDYVKNRVNAIKVPDIKSGRRFLSGCFDSFFVTLLGKWYPYLQYGMDAASEFQHSGKTASKSAAKSTKKLVVRAKGRDVTYSRDLPTFLIREIRVGGSNSDGDFEAEGSIKNICNDVDLLDMPITGEVALRHGSCGESISFAGDFRTVPASNILDIAFDGSSYPLKFEIPDAAEGVPSVSGDGAVRAKIYCGKDKKVGVSASVVLAPATVEAEKFSPDFIYDIYAKVLAEIKTVDFGVDFAYSNENKLDFALESDADAQIAAGLKRVLNQEIGSLKKKLQSELEVRLADVCDDFDKSAAVYSTLKAGLSGSLNDMSGFEDELKAKQAELESQLTDKAEDAVKSSIRKGLKSLF